MGGFDQRASGPGVPGSPTVVIRGLAFWGGVGVKRRPSSRRKKRDGEPGASTDG